MKKPITTFILVLLIDLVHAQNPLTNIWDYRFGGDTIDRLTCFQQTADGGFILGGWSISGISGDKSDSVRGAVDDRDYWIVKTNALGIKQWDKTFGGTNYDYLTSLQQTSDGGYILGGFSFSGISGDKSEPLWSPFPDYWIIKTDALGNKLWDKDFGGTSYDHLYSVRQTSDGGYILGGYSDSGISGNKSETMWGIYDYWILKTDSLGNYQWDRDFGGTSYDQLYSIRQTSDGGYILGGSSQSGISGNKTVPSQGLWDYWIIKTDMLGIKQWEKDFGGTDDDFSNSIQQTNDNGFILGGISVSGISGDKSQPSWGGLDYWIVKTDSLGIKQWDRDYGGTAHEDEFGNVTLTNDSGYLISGTSYSPVSGDKTEINMGVEQPWIVKIDSSGNVQWDKTIFNTAHDELALAIQTIDGCYLIANYTQAGIGGYKTQPNRDTTNLSTDYWIIKFCDTTSTIGISEIPYQQSIIFILSNPFTSEIKISSREKGEIIFYDVTGKVIIRQRIFEGETILNTQELAKGIYIYEMRNKDGAIQNGKVVKE